MQNILTVCTGNICRSPVAQAMLQTELVARMPDPPTVTSAGLHALVGHSIDADSAAAARALGIELHAHRARQFNAQIGREADLILVMEAHHRSEIANRWSHLTGKTFLLGHFEQGEEIPDPYRRGQAMHLHMAELVRKHVKSWADQLEQMT